MSIEFLAPREHVQNKRVKVTERGRGRWRRHINDSLHSGVPILGSEVDMKVEEVLLINPRAIVCPGRVSPNGPWY